MLDSSSSPFSLPSGFVRSILPFAYLGGLCKAFSFFVSCHYMLSVTEDRQAPVQAINQDLLVCINNFQTQLTTHTLLLLAFQICSQMKGPQLRFSILNEQFLRAHLKRSNWGEFNMILSGLI